MLLFADACEEYTAFFTELQYVPFGSDHVPFLNRGFHAMLAIEDEWGRYPCYHQTCDTAAMNQAGFGADVLRATLATAARVAGVPGVTSVTTGGARTTGLSLAPARPNPFGTATTIRFTLPAATDVDLAVHDVAGRRIRTLAKGPRPAGVSEVSWNGRTSTGAPVTAGVYFIRITAGAETVQERVVRLK